MAERKDRLAGYRQAAAEGESRARQAGGRWRLQPRRPGLEETLETLLTPQLRQIFGRWGAQVGACERNLIGQSSLPRTVQISSHPDFPGGLRAASDSLPLASGSIDALLLVFALEFAESPRRLIREAHRVLSDRGRLFVVFQVPQAPASWPRWLGMPGRGLPRGARLVREGRLRDWLELLDFELCASRAFAAGWPWRGEAQGMASAWLADCRVLSARKRVLPLTPVGQRQAVPARERVRGLALGNLRTRNSGPQG